MGIKLDYIVAPSDVHGDNLPKQHDLQEKYAWQHDRTMQYNPVANILRYVEGVSDPSAHVEGIYTQVSSLTNLKCSFDEYTLKYERKFGSCVDAGDKMFTFYDVKLLKNDRISYDNNLWQPIEIWYNVFSGRCDVQVKIIANV